MKTLRRLGQGLISLFVVSVVIWLMMALAPGDPAMRILLARGIREPSPEQVAATQAELGLDLPMVQQYWKWISGLPTANFGDSWTTGRPIATEFLDRLPATLILTLVALLLAIGLTLLLGIPAALWANQWPDRTSRVLSLIALAAPSFLIGVLLMEVITVRMGLGRVLADGTWGTVFLPALTLALGPAAAWSRLLRTSLLETASAPFLAVAKGRGANTRYLLTTHLLPHSAPPMLTVVGLSTAALLGGAPVVETVFTWPGVGLYVVKAIEVRDLPVVADTTMFAVVVYILVSFLTDLILERIEPNWDPEK
ncbi:MAG: glutathione ABC transporter permease [Chloroflexi bacterium]|nr:MAG: glutathione ABC transporter permease [Chloroflexota bacterium]